MAVAKRTAHVRWSALGAHSAPRPPAPAARVASLLHRLWASTSLLAPQPWLGKSVGFGITSSRVWIWTLSLAALGKWVSLCQPGFLYL